MSVIGAKYKKNLDKFYFEYLVQGQVADRTKKYIIGDDLPSKQGLLHKKTNIKVIFVIFIPGFE